MEHDFNLREYLYNDVSIKKKEHKLLKTYLECKVAQCNKNNLTDLEYEDCKRDCAESLITFAKMKRELYFDFTEYNYKSLFDCSKLPGTEGETCRDKVMRSIPERAKQVRDFLKNEFNI